MLLALKCSLEGGCCHDGEGFTYLLISDILEHLQTEKVAFIEDCDGS